MIFRLLLFSALLWLNVSDVMAQGGNKTQFLPEDVGANNSDFSNCSSTLTGGVYYITCSGNVILPNGNNNWVELSATPVVLSISGDLTLGGTDINTLGDQSDLTINVSGNLNPGNNGNIINANMTIAGSINAGNNTDISGGLTISGNVNLGNNSSIEGEVQVSGDLNTGTNVTISGNVDAGGNMNIGQNNNITGDISADTININGSNSTITGDVQAENDLNNSGTIIGNVNVNGNLNNNGTIEGGYVNAPCTETNSCGPGTIDVDLTCNTDNIDENTSACEPGGGGTEIHSLLLTHSGTALTCETFPVTVTACADASCTPVTLSSAEVVVDIGTQSVTANFNDNSSTTANFDLTSPGSYSLSVGDVTGITTTNSPQFSPSNQVTAVDTALRFSGEQTQLSGADFTLGLEAIRTDTDTGACVAAFNTTKAVEFSLTCEDPTACTESVNIEGTPVNSSTAVDVDFTNGSGSLTANYPDVGRIRIQASAQGETTATLTGSSQAFVVKPYGIAFEVLGGIASNSAGSATSYANDDVFERAGEPFTVNLSAINENGTLAPSFGQESLTETLEVKTHELLSPTNQSTNTANEGNLTVNGNQIAFSEVGVIALEAGLTDNDYLGAGVIPNNTSQPIGRFIPDRFVQSNGELFGACGANNFYYMGQEQGFDVQLMAVNTEGNWTQNYYGDFAKGTPEFYGFTTDDVSTASPLNQLYGFSGFLSWENGVTNWLDTQGGVSRDPTIIAGRQADGSPGGHYPNYTLAWQINDGELDTNDDPRYLTRIENSVFDGVQGSALIDSIGLYYGRIVLENTFGSETEQLPVFARVEYYFDDTPEDTEPGRFVLNEQDTCTLILSQQLTDDVSTTDLTAERIPAENDEEQTFTSGQLFSPNTLLSEQFGWVQPDEQQGVFKFQLLLDLSENNLSFLQFDWSGDDSFDDNPEATGTFGIYRGSDRQIYWREVGW
ncbi:MAG: DUF6701 domain-containing protein [Pseudomonadota bacterium]